MLLIELEMTVRYQLSWTASDKPAIRETNGHSLSELSNHIIVLD